MHRDHQTCVRAVQGKDSRFDGQFITGVTSTGIYCRPSCPARTPAPRNMRFFPSAAAAQGAGFRACKRCLPDATPGSPQWDIRADLVGRAMRLIADGMLDRADVPALAAAVGYSPRHLERAMRHELGAGPLGVARAQRAQSARTLIERTQLPLTEVAWAAGFSSIRAFNETMKSVYDLSPRELRSRARPPVAVSSQRATSVGYAEIPVRLAFRPPLQSGQLFGHLIATAVPGVEEWDGTAYRRTLSLPHGHGIVSVIPPASGAAHVAATLHLSDVRDLTAAVRRTRWLLDLDADPLAIDAALLRDPLLAPLVRAAPGRRVPHTVDPHEMALRAVLGQQVSTATARAMAGSAVQDIGVPIEDPNGSLTHLFPPARAWAVAGDEVLRMPRARRATLRDLAERLSSDAPGHALDLGMGAPWGVVRAALADIPGIGPWTIETIAMRALGDPDALLATDLGVRAAAAELDLATTAELVTAAAHWRPWRSYAVQYLWATGAHAINDLPEHSGPPTTHATRSSA